MLIKYSPRCLKCSARMDYVGKMDNEEVYHCPECEWCNVEEPREKLADVLQFPKMTRKQAKERLKLARHNKERNAIIFSRMMSE